MADVRVKISCSDLSLSEQVVPLIWDSLIRSERKRDSANYSVNPKNDMVIRCSDLPSAWTGGGGSATFDTLIAAEGDCNTFDVSVEVYCGGSWSEVWAGQFSSNEWISDRVKKSLKVKPKEFGPIDCLEQNWKTPQNIYDLGETSGWLTVKPYLLVYETYEEPTTGPGTGLACPDPTWSVDYCLYDTIGYAQGDQDICVYYYHRFRLAGTCSGATPVEPDNVYTWNLLTDNCPTDSEWWTCPNSVQLPHKFRHGIYLIYIIEYLVEQTGCGLTVKSDFFVLNPDGTAPSNEAYTAADAQYRNLIVFQKSDVKRHDSSNPASEPAFGINLHDLLHDLKIMFNLDWQIMDGGTTFRLEHVSYFEASVGNDYTSESYKRILERDTADVPRLTRFAYRDEECSAYFKGQPIEIYCGEDETEKRLSLFSCDVAYITSDDAVDVIGDEGFVLMAVVDDGSKLVNSYTNTPLSWTELHTNFHRHNMAGAGKINGVDVTPLSLRPVRKQPPFSVRLCCDDSFSAGDLHTTALGNGQVQNSEVNLKKETLKLELKY